MGSQPAGRRAKLLIVSTGTVEANQALGLASPTVLDEGFKTGRAFGASGTPSAVLVDAQGRIASAVSVGGPNVLAMARGEAAPPPPPAQPSAPGASGCPGLWRAGPGSRSSRPHRQDGQ